MHKIHRYSKKHIYISTSPQSKGMSAKREEKRRRKNERKMGSKWAGKGGKNEKKMKKMKEIKGEKEGVNLTFLSQSSQADTWSFMKLLNFILFNPIFCPTSFFSTYFVPFPIYFLITYPCA